MYKNKRSCLLDSFLITFKLNYAILLIALDKRDTLLPAVFLWNTPLEQALSISETASIKVVLASTLSPVATAVSTFLINVLTLDLICLFLIALVSLTKILFLADFMLANSYTSKYKLIINHSAKDIKLRVRCILGFDRLILCFTKSGHGRSNGNILSYFSLSDLFCQYIFYKTLQKIKKKEWNYYKLGGNIE